VTREYVLEHILWSGKLSERRRHMSTPQSIQVSVLRWAPPVVHGLVRDLRVRWALEEAGLPYSEHRLSREEQKSAGYRKLQPFGQVPAFQSDEVKLFESGAIVLHIAEQSPALMPNDPVTRAQVRAWMFGALNTVEPPAWMLNAIDMQYQGPKSEEIGGLRAWTVNVMELHLDSVVRVLKSKGERDDEGEPYLFDRFTAADLLLTTVLRILRDTDLVEKRPALAAYQRRCEQRPAFQKALADHLASFDKQPPSVW
jgi:glutathione S-transferase